VSVDKTGKLSSVFLIFEWGQLPRWPFTSGHPDCLTVVHLTAYAPDLNPVEGAWPSMKSGLGNLATCTRS
jgi:transposase